jgi:trehalose 6-phosphate phosphatase
VAAPPHPARPLLFLDYDGTLAPLVDDPAAARPHPGVPALLGRLAALHPLWVVTGRDLAALARLLPVEVAAVGLHGAEEGQLGGEAARAGLEAHAGALGRLKAAVPRLPGVHVEEKGGAFAVHYRRAADEAAAREALERWAATAPEALEPIWGKQVVELRPRGVSKGAAVARLAAAHPGRTPVYLGDDVTDEEAFRALHVASPDAVTVKVGAGETAARYRLPDVSAAVAYLRGYAAEGT